MIYTTPHEGDTSTFILYESEDNIQCSSIAKNHYLAISIREKVLLFNISKRKQIDIAD